MKLNQAVKSLKANISQVYQQQVVGLFRSQIPSSLDGGIFSPACVQFRVITRVNGLRSCSVITCGTRTCSPLITPPHSCSLNAYFSSIKEKGAASHLSATLCADRYIINHGTVAPNHRGELQRWLNLAACRASVKRVFGGELKVDLSSLIDLVYSSHIDSFCLFF